MKTAPRSYNGPYKNEYLNQVAFPMGGIGAGMICLEGTGAFSHVSLRHRPEVCNEPLMFAALAIKGARTPRVLEGPVPMRKVFWSPGNAQGTLTSGLPRFANASFETRFPFGIVRLSDRTMPVTVELTGWSPFIPGDADHASLPVAGLEYRLKSRVARPLEGVFSFHARNFLRRGENITNSIAAMPGGFVLSQPGNGRESPFVEHWQVSRPLERSGSIAVASAVRLANDLGWKSLRGEEGFVNVHKRYASQDGMVYLATRVHVARAGSWEIRLGHDGGIRLFVDGKPVIAQPVRENPARRARTKAMVTLEKGEHEILIAFDLCGGQGWGIFFTFALPPNQPGGEQAEFPTTDSWAGGTSPDEGHFAAFTADPNAQVDCAWFRGGGFDPLTMIWNAIASGRAIANPPRQDDNPGNGASLYVPFKLKARKSKTVRLMLAWYVPTSTVRAGADMAGPGNTPCNDGCACTGKANAASTVYIPWYAGRFKSIKKVATYWRVNYDQLREQSKRFSDCFYDTTFPPEVVEAVAANLTILKSPTSLRDREGRFWGWEGCGDTDGCCHGSCSHVWNYAQALPHLFPSLERTMRETEFLVDQDERGHQSFRANLPIRPPDHTFHAAADGQLGGLMKLYREWRVSGDTAWMKKLWPRARDSMDYCIATWDPNHTGTLIEPHHNTYDIEFWGADGMCTSFYLGALEAAIAMGRACGADVKSYELLVAEGKTAMETKLWNGEYFIQKVQWTGLRAPSPEKALSALASYTTEALDILKEEGPKYQYGHGCLSDGVLGDWMARVCGMATVLDSSRVARHLGSVFRYNFKASLADHANPQRPMFATGREGGLLVCSWPKGGKLSLPFPYSNEVWTGIEYQAASHLIMMGRIREGLQIVRAARARYDGRYRNPFNEYECGHWYARAMSSYGLLQALSGARYDAVDKTLHLQPAVKGNFKAFLSTATGFGTVGIRNGKPFLKIVSGRIDVARIEYRR